VRAATKALWGYEGALRQRQRLGWRGQRVVKGNAAKCVYDERARARRANRASEVIMWFRRHTKAIP